MLQSQTFFFFFHSERLLIWRKRSLEPCILVLFSPIESCIMQNSNINAALARQWTAVIILLSPFITACVLFNLSHVCNVGCQEGLKEDNSQFKSVICEVCVEKGLYFTGRGKQCLMADDQRHRCKPHAKRWIIQCHKKSRAVLIWDTCKVVYSFS